MPDTSPYCYRPVDPYQCEIRVIRFVSPSSDPSIADLVHCTLENVLLDDFADAFHRSCAGGDHASATTAILDGLKSDATNGRLPPPTPAEIAMPLWRLRSDRLGFLAGAMNINDANVPPLPFDVRCGIPPIPRILSRDPYRPRMPGRLFGVEPRFRWGDFEAVSYCWESDVRDRRVVVDGHVVAVPRNLEAVLQRLRRLPEATGSPWMRFWVDALCIDQGNLAEKGRQVALMRHIYASALSVVAWLGAATDDSERAVDVLPQLARVLAEESKVWKRWSWGDESPLWEHWDRAAYEAWFAAVPWRAVLALLDRAYWSRLWIIQELALNHNMTLFLCGDRQMSRWLLEQVAEFCRSHETRINRLLGAGTNRPGDGTMEDGQEGVEKSQPPPPRTFDVVTRVSSLLTLRARPGNAPAALDLGRRARVKESKDKVYGLLGILPDYVADRVAPDYSDAKSQDQVYLQFAVALLSGEQRIDSLLAWCTFDEESTLPSWCPDWEVHFPRNHVPWLKRLRAGGSTQSEYRFSEDGRTLACRGFVVDSIADLGLSPAESRPYKTQKSGDGIPVTVATLPNQYGDRGAVAVALQNTLFIDHPGRHGEGTDTALGRALATKQPPQVQFASNIYWVDWSYLASRGDEDPGVRKFWQIMKPVTERHWWEVFERFRQTNADFSVFGHPLREFFPDMRPLIDNYSTHASVNISSSPSHISSPQCLPGGVGPDSATPPRAITSRDYKDMMLIAITAVGRRLAVTTKGRIGLVPEATRRGDILAVLHGCAFPVVLRPVESKFKVVGECFIEGLMKGEAMAAAPSTDSDSFLALC